MGIIINQSVRNAYISYIGIVIGFIATIKLYPTILDTNQFGLTRVMLAIMTLSTQLVNIGVPTSIIKFFPRLSKISSNPNALLWVFSIPPFIAFIVFTLLIVGLDDLIISFYESDSDLFGTYYLFLLPLVFFSSSFALLNSFVKAHLNTIFASFLQEIFHRLVVIANLLLFSFSIISFDTFILIFVFNYGLKYLLLFIYAMFKKMVSIKFSMELFTPELRKSFFSYSFFVFFGGFTMILVGNIDLIMVGTFEGLSKSGIYAIALYVGSVISVPKKSIGKISLPVIAKSFEENDLENIKKVYTQSSLNQFLAGLLIYVGVLANIDNLYDLLPEDYNEGSIVIYIIGIAHLFDMVCGANGQIILSSKYYRFDLYSSFILMFAAIIFNLILIPKFGLLGAALATASSIFLFNTIKLIYIWIKMDIHPFKFSLIGILITGLVALFLSNIIGAIGNTYLDIFVRSVAIAVFYVACIWIFKLSDDFNALIKSFVNKLLRH